MSIKEDVVMDSEDEHSHEDEDEVMVEEPDEDEDNEDNEDIDGNDAYAEDENPLLGAFRQLANAHRNGVPASSVLENMGHILPGSLIFGNPHTHNSRLDGYVNAINSRDDPYTVLDSINELSERLLMMNALDAERGLPHYQLSKALIGVLNEPIWQEHMELQIVACRCLYNLLEIEPTYCRAAIECGIVECLKSKLMEISFIDLAEQALQTLEFISRFQGHYLLAKDCLSAVLMYLDFFTIHAQRKAVRIIANSVKFVTLSHISTVEQIFPVLQRIVIEYPDSQELDSAWTAITLVVNKLYRSSHLEKIVTPELLDKMFQVITSSDTTLSTIMKLLNTLSLCAQNKNLSVEIIGTGKVGDSLNAILHKYQKNNESNTITIETLISMPKDLTVAVLFFIAYLLPSDPEPVLTVEDQVPKDYSQVMDHYKQFCNQCFALLINIYSATVVFEIRRLSLVNLLRIVGSFPNLKELEDRAQIVNLLASIVIQSKGVIQTEKNSQNPYVVLLAAFLLSHVLITKDPGVFLTEFEREGLFADTSNILVILRQDERNTATDTRAQMAQAVDDADSSSEKEDEQEHYQEEEEEEEEDEEDFEQEEQEDLLSEDDYSDGYEEPRVEPVSAEKHNLFKTFDMKTILNKLTYVASMIEREYLSRKAGGGSKVEHLRLLEELSESLRDVQICSQYDGDEWRQMWNTLKDTLVNDTCVISSFELINSGIIEVFSNLFKGDRFGSSDSLARTTFLDVFQGDVFKVFVKKLQESLTRAESFGIIGCGLKIGENRAVSLGKQLKLKLTYLPDDDDENPLFDESMSSFVILVHAIASFNNINLFLKKRVSGMGFFAPSRPQLDDDWYLEFLLDGQVIPLETTIYGALYKHLQTKNSNFDTSRFWHEVHHVQFRKVNGKLPYLDMDEKYPNTSEDELYQLNQQTTIGILNMLKVLYEFHGEVDEESLFVNYKLTAKLRRQLEEPLIVASGILPNWSIHITRTFPFLFPLETRIFFLQSTSFGYSRLIQLWSSKAIEEDNNPNYSSFNNMPLGRATRFKVRVSRQHLLKSAYKVLSKLGAQPSILEIEFTDEVGTGLGPTLEFYSNVCHCFAEKGLGLWRDHGGDLGDEKHVYSELGLFPAPIALQDPNFMKRMTHFKYLGKFIARALLDHRILDFNFNPVFFELCQMDVEQGSDVKFGLEKLKQVDEQLYKSLVYLKKNGETVSDLGINYTVPGYGIELVEGGSEVYLTSAHEIDGYIEMVVDWTFNCGVKEQIENFVIGFSEVLPYYSMLVFSPHEIVQLMGQSSEDWSFETLMSCIHADHGYNIDSKTVHNLIKVMTGFNKDERRAFLKFLTGSPRLPIGGFKNLKPEFTVVMKRAEQGHEADDYLPSVMTCANYLKMPNYTTLEVLASRVKTAVEEGAGAFLLS